MDSQFCQAHTPHPLGKDRDRFLYLINDIKNRKDDYAAQLSHITLASLSNTRATGDGSKQEIVSSLLRCDSTVEKQPSKQERDMLWQARLILEIGAILDREQEEVAEALVMLDENETDLFAKLKGSDEDNESENLYQELERIKSKLGAPRAESIKNRMRAWFRLTKNFALPHCPVWTTTRQETADILFENHEKKAHSPPPFIAKIFLPARTGRNQEQVMGKIETFLSDAADNKELLLQKILLATTDISMDKDFCKVSADWHQLLELHFPSEKYGRTAIQFFHFGESLTNFSGSKSNHSVNKSHILAVFAS